MTSLWCRGKSAALSSATEHAISPELGGKWVTCVSVLTLGSLCLACCVTT